MSEAELLASDAEREQAVATLRAHLGDGRLTVEEFAARVDEAYAARTDAQLREALRGLPETPSPPALAHPAIDWSRIGRRAGWFATVSGVCVLIWALTGANGSFWPKWVMLALAIRLALTVGPALFRQEHEHDEEHERSGLPRPPLPPLP